MRPPHWAAPGLAGPRAQRLAVSGTRVLVRGRRRPPGGPPSVGPVWAPWCWVRRHKTGRRAQASVSAVASPPPLQSLARCLPCSFPAMPSPLSAAGSPGAAALGLHAVPCSRPSPARTRLSGSAWAFAPQAPRPEEGLTAAPEKAWPPHTQRLLGVLSASCDLRSPVTYMLSRSRWRALGLEAVGKRRWCLNFYIRLFVVRVKKCGHFYVPTLQSRPL